MLNKYKMPATGQDSLYASSTIDKTTNELIIKIVNIAAKVQLADLIIEGVNKVQSKAKLTVLQSDHLEAENRFDSGLKLTPVETEINTKGKTITVQLKPYSFSVIRVGLF
jgi:alpha-L-arabinofuranosidase